MTRFHPWKDRPLQNPLQEILHRLWARGMNTPRCPNPTGPGKGGAGMWFDPHAALKQLGGGDVPPPDPAPRVAQVAQVARPHPAKSDASGGSLMAGTNTRTGAREVSLPYKRADPYASPLPSDLDTYHAALSIHGPLTYGAAAVALGWGATRAWQAEAALVAEGRATLSTSGRASCARVKNCISKAAHRPNPVPS